MEQESFLTNQKIFTRVKDHLLSQNRKSQDISESCQYRSSNGLKCAVGCLISDQDYNSRIEGLSIQNLINYRNSPSLDPPYDVNLLQTVLMKSRISPESFEFLERLQRIHDLYPSSSWEEELRNLATQSNLEY